MTEIESNLVSEIFNFVANGDRAGATISIGVWFLLSISVHADRDIEIAR